MKKTTVLILLLSILSDLAWTDPLDEALDLVISKSAVVQTKNHIMGIVGKASDLKGTVSLATDYAEKQTGQFVRGADACAKFQIEYPIFGGGTKTTHDQEKFLSINVLSILEEQLRNQFIMDIQNLALLERAVRGLIQMHTLKVDRLKVVKQVNDKATGPERIDLWPLIEEAQRAEDAAFQADQKFLIELERMSRSYGKDEHERLHQLVLAHVRQTGSPLKTRTPEQ